MSGRSGARQIAADAVCLQRTVMQSGRRIALSDAVAIVTGTPPSTPTRRAA